MPLRIRGLK